MNENQPPIENIHWVDPADRIITRITVHTDRDSLTQELNMLEAWGWEVEYGQVSEDDPFMGWEVTAKRTVCNCRMCKMSAKRRKRKSEPE